MQFPSFKIIKQMQNCETKMVELYTNKRDFQEAIEKNSIDEYVASHVSGDVDKGLAEAEMTIEGVIETGAQEHMYMEPISALVVPKREDKEMEVFVNTQEAANCQVNHSAEI